MPDVSKRVFCPECGVVRMRNTPSLYAVCPNGHGKLVPKFTATEERHVLLLRDLPRAMSVGRNKYEISGHKGLYEYHNRNGIIAAKPGQKIADGEVIACRVSAGPRVCVRVFSACRVKPTTEATE